MTRFEHMAYTDKIKWRIRILYLIIIAMLVYMVVVVEVGGGDARIMTDLAQGVYRIIFFGGMSWFINRIVHNKKLLANRRLCREQMLAEQDERNQYLHDKSGGVVVDILLVSLMVATVTAALFDMAAFYTAFAMLMTAIIVKVAAYFIVSHWM